MSDKRRELRSEHLEKVRKTPASELWLRWQRNFPWLTSFVTNLIRNMEIYRDLSEIVQENPRTLKPARYFIWIRDNYIVSECMGIRRLLDVDSRSLSLGRLLREIEVRPQLVNRTRYRELVADRLSQHGADRSFRVLVGSPGTELSASLVTADIDRLENTEKNIRNLTNKRFAHAEPFSRVDEFPLFAEIENAVQELDRVVVKYDSLVHGGFMSTARVEMLNWKPPLEVAWIQSRHHKTG